jgi:hypothetical protein
MAFNPNCKIKDKNAHMHDHSLFRTTPTTNYRYNPDNTLGNNTVSSRVHAVRTEIPAMMEVESTSPQRNITRLMQKSLKDDTKEDTSMSLRCMPYSQIAPSSSSNSISSTTQVTSLPFSSDIIESTPAEIHKLCEITAAEIAEEHRKQKLAWGIIPSAHIDECWAKYGLPKTTKELNNEQLLEHEINDVSGFTKLEELDISPEFIDEDFKIKLDFDKLPKSLKRLFCSCRDTVTDEEIAKLRHCNKLEELDVSGIAITGKHFNMLPKSLQRLYCGMHHPSTLTDDAIKGLEHCDQLEVLDISDTSITGQYFDKLPQSLKRLVCARCKSLTQNALAILQQRHVEIINY